jgi:hypothetical protein
MCLRCRDRLLDSVSQLAHIPPTLRTPLPIDQLTK